MIVALSWGIGLACHGFFAIVAPGLQRAHDRPTRFRRRVRARRDARAAHARRGARARLEELSASIAHEIRNPITAAKSLVQQMGEDPTSARERRVREGRARRARPRRALDRAPAALRARGGHASSARCDSASVVESALDTLRERIERAARARRARRRRRGRAASPTPSSCAACSSTWSATRSTRSRRPRTPIAAHRDRARARTSPAPRSGCACATTAPASTPQRARADLRARSTPRRRGGTGLGLAIAKKVVEAPRRQRSRSSSQPGAGHASSSITLPQRRHAESRAVKRAHPGRRGRARDPARARRPAAQGGLRGRRSPSAATTRCASSRASAFDLVLTDLALGDGPTGMDVLRASEARAARRRRS